MKKIMLIGLMFILLCSFVSGMNMSLHEKLIWTFNVGEYSAPTQTDMSGNGITGTVGGSPTLVQGVHGGALDLDATTELVESASIAVPDIGCINMWASAADGVYTYAYGQYWKGIYGAFECDAGDAFAGVNYGDNAYTTTSAVTVCDGSFHMFTHSWNLTSGVANVYIDGRHNGTTTSMSDTYPDNKVFYVGQRNAASVRDMVADEVYYYTTQCDQDMVDQLWNDGDGCFKNQTECYEDTGGPPPVVGNTSYLNTLGVGISPGVAYTDTTIYGAGMGNSSSSFSYNYQWYINLVSQGVFNLDSSFYTTDAVHDSIADFYTPSRWQANHNYTLCNDGDFTTSCQAGLLLNAAQTQYNFSIPDNVDVDSSLIYIKTGAGSANYSIPKKCLNYSDTFVLWSSLEYASAGPLVTGGYYQCLDNAGAFPYFLSQSGGSNYSALFDFKIYWAFNLNTDIVNNTLQNITILPGLEFNKGDSIIFSTQAYNASDEDIWLNSSAVTILNSLPVVGLVSPANDTQSNNLLEVEFSYDDVDGDVGNCTLYLGGIANKTETNMNDGSSYTIDADSMDVGGVDWYVNCTDGSGVGVSQVRYYIYDPVNPIINTDFVNESVYVISDTISEWINFSDNVQLWSYNVSVDGSQINGSTEINSTGFNLSFNLPLSGYSIGSHTLTVRVADGHTAVKLKDDYVFSDGLLNNYAKYEWENGNWIKTVKKDGLIGDSLRSAWSSVKQTDRFIHTYVPDKAVTSITFIETSSSPIYIIRNSRDLYKGAWIVTDDKWKDYVLPAYPNSKVSIKRLSEFSVEVTITNKDPMNVLEFHSIGEINIIEKDYVFTVTNASVSYPGNAVELFRQNHVLYVNKTASVATNANFTYNNTLMTVVKTSYTSFDKYNASFIYDNAINQTYNMSFTWLYNVYNGTSAEESITNSHILYDAALDDCDAYSTKAINFSIYETSNSSLITGAISTQLTIYGDNSSQSETFNIAFSGNSTYHVCINPSFATYTLSGTAVASVAGRSGTKSVTYTDVSLSDESFGTRFSFNTNEQQVIIRVLDYNEDPVNDVLITISEYDIATGNSNVTDTPTTGTNGIAITTLELNDKYYIFDLSISGIFVKREGPQIIVSTDNTIRLNLVTDYLDIYDLYNSVACTVSYSNASKTFTTVWNNAGNGTVAVCTEVIERTMLGDIAVNSSCETSNNGTFTLMIPNPPNNSTYIGTASATYLNETFLCNSVDASYDDRWKIVGLSGIFVSFLLILTLTMIGVWNPMVAIILNMVGVIVVNILQLYHLNWTALVLFIILGVIAIYKINRR